MYTPGKSYSQATATNQYLPDNMNFQYNHDTEVEVKFKTFKNRTAIYELLNELSINYKRTMVGILQLLAGKVKLYTQNKEQALHLTRVLRESGTVVYASAHAEDEIRVVLSHVPPPILNENISHVIKKYASVIRFYTLKDSEGMDMGKRVFIVKKSQLQQTKPLKFLLLGKIEVMTFHEGQTPYCTLCREEGHLNNSQACPSRIEHEKQNQFIKQLQTRTDEQTQVTHQTTSRHEYDQPASHRTNAAKSTAEDIPNDRSPTPPSSSNANIVSGLPCRDTDSDGTLSTTPEVHEKRSESRRKILPLVAMNFYMVKHITFADATKVLRNASAPNGIQPRTFLTSNNVPNQVALPFSKPVHVNALL